MKLKSANQSSSLQSEIKRRFSEYSRSNPSSKGRRFPLELKELVARGRGEGLKVALLCRLTGVSKGAITRWSEAAVKDTEVRKLSVASERPSSTPNSSVVIRLSSGVTIEFRDGQSLEVGLLRTLNSLEVSNASSC